MSPADSPNGASDTQTALLSPVERLALTRERLRQTMQETASRRRSKQHGGSWLMGLLTAVPGVGMVVDSLRGWWAQHPLRMVTLIAGDAAKTMMRPVARNRPVALIVGALVVGGLLVYIRPWRGLLKPALFASLMPHLVSRAMAQVPVESWLSAIVAMVKRTGGPRASAPAASAHSDDAAAQAAATHPHPPVRESTEPAGPARPGATVH